MTWLMNILVKWLLPRFSVPLGAIRFSWRRYRDRSAIITPSRTLSYPQLRARTMRLVAQLSALGLKKGDVWHLQVGCTCDLVAANLAAMESGLILTGIPATAYEQMLAHFLQAVSPNEIFFDFGFDQDASTLRQRVPNIALLAVDHLSEDPGKSRYVPVPIAADDFLAIGFTSGASAPPKLLAAYPGVFLTSLRLVFASGQLDIPKPPDLSLMGSLIAGAGSGLILPTFLSGSMRLVPLEYTATEFLRLISERRVTRLFTTPSLLIDMLDHPNFDRYNPTGLRNLICGTQWMSAQKIEEALRRLGPILQQGCASVEMLPPGSMLQPPERWRDGKIGPRSGLSSVGRVVPQLHAIIADEDDGPSAQAGIGNILIKGPTQFSGYFHQPELTAHGLRRGWLHTANMGYIDTESLPVEEILHDHPAVKETAYAQVGTSAILALSLRHAWRSRLQKPALQQELMEYPSERVSVEDLPDSLHLVNELPRSPLGKALRRKGASCFRPKSAIGRGCLLQNNRFQYG